MFDDDFDVTEATPAPPPPGRIQTVAELDIRNIQVGDKIILLDSTWHPLFPTITFNHPNLCTVFIAECMLGDRYELGIVDIVPIEGRIALPAGIRSTVSREQLRAALAATEAMRAEPEPRPAIPKSPHRQHRPMRRQTDYDAMKDQLLTSSGKIEVKVPEGVVITSFRNMVQGAMLNRGLTVRMYKIDAETVQVVVVPDTIS